MQKPHLDRPVAAATTPLHGLLVQGGVQAGFPSPAEDLGAQRIDLAQLLVHHAHATFFLRAAGHSMTGTGIQDQDLLMVDRAIKPRNGHIVVAVVDGDFTVKQLSLRDGHMRLKAANPDYPDITPREGQSVEVWGVVTCTIKQFCA